MTLSEIVEGWLDEKWISAKEMSDKVDCPLSSATSALATLCKFRDNVERQVMVSGKAKRPVWHYRRLNGS